ncbi:MAG: hypothetical protein PVH88_11790 [Ignavibacteria bacterium]|jgi:hypothetical protein
MEKRTFITISFILFLFFNGCENLNDTGQIEIHQSVFIDVSVNRDQQEYYVYNTLDISETLEGWPFSAYDEAFADNAVITITGEDGISYSDFCMNLRDSIFIKRKYITNTSKLNLKPDTKYKVSIEYNGETVTGEVKTLKEIPGFYTTVAQNDSDYVKGELFWDDLEDAEFYVSGKIYYDKKKTVSELDEYIWVMTEFLEKQANYQEKFSIRKPYKNYDSVKVAIIACDENIYKHFYEDNGQVNVTDNAYGYIGSSIIADTTFVFTE